MATQMAAWHTRRRSGAVLNFLLDGGWDLENSENLQHYIWANFMDQQTDISEPIKLVHSTRDLEPWLQVSRRAFDLGHEFDKHLNYFNNSVMFYLSDQSAMKRLEPEAVRTVVHFLVSHGADIDQEEKYSSNRETALLLAAHSGVEDSLLWLRVLLEHGADYTVRDVAGRGPLHLTLKKHRTGYEESGEDPPATSMRLMEAKLVYLIRAGCSIHEVDDLGATPTDLARESCLRIVWENALREVDMLDDKMLELIDKEVRQHYPCGPTRIYKSLSTGAIFLCETNQFLSRRISSPIEIQIFTFIISTAMRSTSYISQMQITVMVLKTLKTGLSMTNAKTAMRTWARKKMRMRARP